MSRHLHLLYALPTNSRESMDVVQSTGAQHSLPSLNMLLNEPGKQHAFSEFVQRVVSLASQQGAQEDLARFKNGDLSVLKAGLLFGGLVAQNAKQLLFELAEDGDAGARKILRSVFQGKVIYPGSFDPFTEGHKDLVRRAVKIFPEVIIGVGINPGKTPLFTLRERVKMIEQELGEFGSAVTVTSFGTTLPEFAHGVGARIVLRGVRALTDFDQETAMAHSITKLSEGNIETFFVPASPQYSYVSSTFARHLAKFRQDLSGIVSPHIAKKLEDRLFAERSKELSSRWANLFGQEKKTEAQLHAFDAIVKAYTHPDRAYHTLMHLASMFELFDKISQKLSNPRAVAFAIFLHDLVYDPKANNNEGQSADRGDELLAACGVDLDTRAIVRQLILATAHSSGRVKDYDTQCLLDIDLSILGSSPDEYPSYAAAIRKEYSFVPEKDFNEGRSAILKSFLERPAIFRTDDFAYLEPRAETNLRKELEALAA